ncbi:MAG: hypothetical protein ACOYZ7_20410 [Chloroflexota bacterium]
MVKKAEKYRRYRQPHAVARFQARTILWDMFWERCGDLDHDQQVALAERTGAAWFIEAIEKGFWYELHVWPSASTMTEIVIKIEHNPATRWEDVKEKVLTEAKEQFDAARQKLREAEGLETSRDRKRANLERAVGFVFQRVILKRPTRSIWNRWDTDHPGDDPEALTEERLRSTISETAKLLDVNLSPGA